MLCDECERFRFPNAGSDVDRGVSHPARVGKKSNRLQTEDRAVKACSQKEDHRARRDPVRDAEATNTTSTAALAAAAGSDMPKKVIVSEVMAYICYYRHRSNADALRRVVLSFFSAGDISDAKRLLTSEFQASVGISGFLADRRDSSTRTAKEAEIEDILSICDVIDFHDAFANYIFVAANLENLPKYGPEELNVAAVVEKQAKMEVHLASIETSVERIAAMAGKPGIQSTVCDPQQQKLQTMVDEMSGKIAVLNSSVDARLDQLTALCTTLATSSAARTPTDRLENADRDMNIVIYGIQEDRDNNVWKMKVDQVLQFVAGAAVDTVDMYRVGGRYAAGRNRPVIVKLRTFWDKRIILNSSSKLKNYADRVFIAPDEPVEVRRQKTLERLKYRAEREHKIVQVSNGVLSIDGTAVFSIETGFIRT